MTQTAPPPVQPLEAFASTVESARTELLNRVFATFDRLHISYCVTHGYHRLPNVIESDVDMVVAPSQMMKIRTALSELGGSSRLIQWVADVACWAAVASDGESGQPAIVQLHFSPGFELAEHLYYRADEITATRQRHNNFWIPATKIEFACICINRSIKANFKPSHLNQLAALYQQDPSGCETEIRRFFDSNSVEKILSTAREHKNAMTGVSRPNAPTVLNTTPIRVARAAGKWKRRLARWIRPRNGLHVVFLGPDGVGKSTVIDSIRHAILPAFLRTDYMTFAPSFIPAPLQPKKDSPHQLPPRSLPGSLMKAAWWSLCYTAGYYATVRPAAARSSLILNHRYLLDAIVDSKRYRYAGPKFLLKMIWIAAPKPDVIFLLDAPAEVIQGRKQEVPLAETARQREAYRRLIAGKRNAFVLDTNRSLSVVTDEAINVLFNIMSRRMEAK
jgi:thymidylate kinase